MVVSKSAPLPRPWREKVVTAWCPVSLTIAKTLQIIGLLQTATLHETEEEAVNTVAGSALGLDSLRLKEPIQLIGKGL